MGVDILSLSRGFGTAFEPLFALVSSWHGAGRKPLALGGTNMGLPGTGAALTSGTSRCGAFGSGEGAIEDASDGPDDFFGGGGLLGGTTGR